MKFTFEKDIQAFAGKSAEERRELWKEAAKMDGGIRLRGALISLLWVQFLMPLMILRQQKILPSLWVVLILFVLIGIPLRVLANALWVNELVDKALQRKKD